MELSELTLAELFKLNWQVEIELLKRTWMWVALIVLSVVVNVLQAKKRS